MQICVPYGNGHQALEVPQGRVQVLESDVMDLRQSLDEDSIVLEAIGRPICSPALCQLAQGKQNAVIIISDYTLPFPTKHIIHLMTAVFR